MGKNASKHKRRAAAVLILHNFLALVDCGNSCNKSHGSAADERTCYPHDYWTNKQTRPFYNILQWHTKTKIFCFILPKLIFKLQEFISDLYGLYYTSLDY